MMATVGCDDDDKATNETGCFPERGQVHREKAVEELKSKTGVDFHKFWGLAQFSLAAVVWGGNGHGAKHELGPGIIGGGVPCSRTYLACFGPAVLGRQLIRLDGIERIRTENWQIQGLMFNLMRMDPSSIAGFTRKNKQSAILTW